MHIYKSRFLKRGEVWYDNEPTASSVDWIFYRQRRRAVSGAKCTPFYTNLLELGQAPEALLQNMSKSNVYKIKRARNRDNIVCKSTRIVNAMMLDKFEQAYAKFAASKNLPSLDRPLLDQLAEDGFLEVSLAYDPAGKPLVYHVYYFDPRRSCMLHSVSLYKLLEDSSARNLIGRANRYLFWCDILRHKEQGLNIFDFGGWYPGKSDPVLLAINSFKQEFGGKVVQEYNYEQILTLKGRVVLTVASWLHRLKSLSAKIDSKLGPKSHLLTSSSSNVSGAEPCFDPAQPRG